MLLFVLAGISLTYMTYCYISHMTDRYCDALGESQALEEAFADTKEYEEALEAYEGTEEEFWNSPDYENALEEWVEWEKQRGIEAYYEL